MLVEGPINKIEVHAYTVLVKNHEEKIHFEACKQMWVLCIWNWLNGVLGSWCSVE
jgi:hypothetical protein